MTKKDYFDIAAALSRGHAVYLDIDETPETVAAIVAFQNGKQAALKAITDALCTALHADNPHFKRERFIAAIKGA